MPFFIISEDITEMDVDAVRYSVQPAGKQWKRPATGSAM